MSESKKEYLASKLVDLEDMNTIVMSRWNVVNQENSNSKIFDYFRDIDLLLNYDFDFENGRWLEFEGFLEKMFNEKTALQIRAGMRSYEKPLTSKNAHKIYQEKENKFKMKMKMKYSLSFSKQEVDKKINQIYSSLKNWFGGK